jgi:hypothetical protein
MPLPLLDLSLRLDLSSMMRVSLLGNARKRNSSKKERMKEREEKEEEFRSNRSTGEGRREGPSSALIDLFDGLLFSVNMTTRPCSKDPLVE